MQAVCILFVIAFLVLPLFVGGVGVGVVVSGGFCGVVGDGGVGDGDVGINVDVTVPLFYFFVL